MVRHDGAIVDAVRQLPQVIAVATKVISKQTGRQLTQLADRLDAQPFEDPSGGFSHAPQAGHGQWVEELRDAVRLDNDKPVRLIQVAGDLGEELVRRHTNGRRQMQFVANRGFDLPADFGRRPQQPSAAGYVQERFVQGERFHERREPAENLADLLRHLSVVVDTGRQKDGCRAQPFRLCRRHGTADTKLAGHVVGSRDDTSPLRRATNNDRLAE